MLAITVNLQLCKYIIYDFYIFKCNHFQIKNNSLNKASKIGSSLYKLYKPWETNPYNDLVKQFQLQVLHQPFEFKVALFRVNMTLLGSVS